MGDAEQSELEAKRQQLFIELRRTGDRAIRNELVDSYVGLAEFFATRYQRRVGDADDLSQVARVALVNAVDRFDPSFGVKFSTFAGRTIDGELKNYLRDRTWSVRVPRSLLELAVEVRSVSDTLTNELGRPPTVDELAARADVEPDLVIQALDAQRARQAESIDQPAGWGDGPSVSEATNPQPLASTLGGPDTGLDQAVSRLTARSLLDTLDERERSIVELRFFDGLNQRDIAERLGISQMHVSRLLRRALDQLRHRHDTA